MEASVGKPVITAKAGPIALMKSLKNPVEIQGYRDVRRVTVHSLHGALKDKRRESTDGGGGMCACSVPDFDMGN